ncbi:ferrochelatase [Candidatus Chlamydia sanziniae]|uniref:Ferrochelatase n=1 Tax=Candidatus Chlamydia sanziniae TaxID=1806891 RepID=A0A1A9HWC2_9CHLA|nr:ferrochelatase [Candidatus Chlamydia sanziniae]ANH78402.1 Ferrochelatase, protoheme ferro-lyase [Candidatus Chlamydia sanziniae]
MSTSIYILANFGGPRHSGELSDFLTTLLTDRDVTGTCLPSYLHKKFFAFIAKKRVTKVLPQYQSLKSWSPIYSDTEDLAETLAIALQSPVIPFHRYLPSTHARTLSHLRSLCSFPIVGVPLFPHFTYAVTGSIVRFFHMHIPERSISWLPYFGSHRSFISALACHLRNFLHHQKILEKECCFLFSAHGLPVKYVRQGDPYAKQCEESFVTIASMFKEAKSLLCYQSKFGPGQWLSPATVSVCRNLQTTKPYVILIPFGFIFDHLETLYEIEQKYLPILQVRGYQAFRLPAISSMSPSWISTLVEIIRTSPTVNANILIK